MQASTAAPIAAASRASPALNPKIDPNSARAPSRPLPPPEPVLSRCEAQHTPRPSTQANTIPIVTSSALARPSDHAEHERHRDRRGEQPDARVDSGRGRGDARR